MNCITCSMMSLAFGGNKETLLNEKDKCTDFWKEMLCRRELLPGHMWPPTWQGALDNKVSSIAKSFININREV